MNSVKKIKGLFWSSVAVLFVMSATFSFMPFAVTVGNENRPMVIAIGSIFWLSAIIGYTLLIIANGQRRRLVRNEANSNPAGKSLPGIISFFTNVPGTIADVVMILSLAALIIMLSTSLKYAYFVYVLLSIWTFSLNMHCLFNGRIYKTIKH